MPLHPVIEERLNVALWPDEARALTPRDAHLPAVPGKAHAVTGMRRAGKTTFLCQLLAERRAAVPPERALYLSFDNDRLANLGVEQLSFLLKEFYRRHPALRGRETVLSLLDKIQLVPGWERFVRRVMDTERAKFLVSGSSARMLSREVHTSLRGMETVIRPFGFREILRHRGNEPDKPAQRWTSAERSGVEQRFRESLGEGLHHNCPLSSFKTLKLAVLTACTAGDLPIPYVMPARLKHSSRSTTSRYSVPLFWDTDSARITPCLSHP